jgi:hypothetical protein
MTTLKPRDSLSTARPPGNLRETALNADIAMLTTLFSSETEEIFHLNSSLVEQLGIFNQYAVRNRSQRPSLNPSNQDDQTTFMPTHVRMYVNHQVVNSPEMVA